MDDNLHTVLRRGGCVCGKVVFSAAGEPDRVGLCHCLICRKRHGAPFNAFATFRADQVQATGEVTGWRSEHGMRYGCRDCGSPLWWGDDAGQYIELHLGSFDEPGGLTPEYEIWAIHREPWLPSFDLPQHDRNPVRK